MPQQVILPIKGMEIYAYADLAAGEEAKRKLGTARQAIVVGARDQWERWFIIHDWAGRISAPEFRDMIIDTYKKFHPYRFGLEANGMQVLFGALVREKAEKEITGDVTFIPIYQPKNVKKPYRIRTGLQPVIADRRLFILDKTGELAQEIRGFPTNATMDLVDALETMIRMAPKNPDGEHPIDAEVKAYAKYLRQSGMPAYQIQERVAEYEKQLRFQVN